jgi:Cu+-exporting ATPase
LHARPESADLEQIREILVAQDPAATMTVEELRLRITTSQHPADILLRLADIGLEASLEETFVDPGLRQAEEARREMRLAWRRAILAGVVGSGVMAGHMTGLFPHPQHGQSFWVGIALLCLMTMI